jgi:hypothetical protein
MPQRQGLEERSAALRSAARLAAQPTSVLAFFFHRHVGSFLPAPSFFLTTQRRLFACACCPQAHLVNAHAYTRTQLIRVQLERMQRQRTQLKRSTRKI